jgi:hypothetical protein
MADLNTTLRLALRSPKEPLNSEPTEALHFPSGTVPAVGGPAPAVDSPVQAMALALKGLGGPHADPPAVSSRGSVDDSPVKVIDGDHYAGQASGSAIP